MMYWLEYKNDDEFSTISFGGIGGGSALKFGVFRRKETGNWAVAGKGNIPEEITVGQAVEIAQKQRDQLLRGIDLLGTLAGDAGDESTAHFRTNLERLAPDVSNFAWAHKYFHLMFPDKLDDFHNEDWQRFYLRKVLQQPPSLSRIRYVCADAVMLQWPWSLEL